jgi:chaperonin cofactor prefoldin
MSLKGTKNKKQERRAELERDKAEYRQTLSEIRVTQEELRRRREDARKDGREVESEQLADRLDTLKGKARRLEKKIRHKATVLGRLSAQIERLGKRIKKVRKKKYYASENFLFSEFDCNDGTKIPEAAKPAIRAWCEQIGEPLRARFGTVHINSGYRHRAYNAAVGGEPNSVHIYDLHPSAVAGDLTCEKGSPRDWFYFTEGRADGRGLYATFHHADNRNRIGWSDATWTG